MSGYKDPTDRQVVRRHVSVRNLIDNYKIVVSATS